MTDLNQADVETRTRNWSITDAAGAALIPSKITFVVRRGDTDVVYTTDGAGGSIAGVTDNLNGTGTWKVSAGELGVGTHLWWALAVVDTDTIVPESMSGTITIEDR